MELGDWDYGFVFGVGAGVGLFGSAGLGWRIVEITALVPCNTPRVSSPASMAWPIVMRVRALRLKANGLLIEADCLGGTILAGEHTGQIAVGVGLVWI